VNEDIKKILEKYNIQEDDLNEMKICGSKTIYNEDKI
jgi:hypothetical protein